MLISLLALLSISCTAQQSENQKGTVAAAEPADSLAVATFAGGCFWCMEAPFEVLEGVQSVKSGYTYGQKDHPTYRQVSSGQTDHVESVRIVYDPDVIAYDSLLYVFWRNIKPTQADGQFYDRGDQYKTYIFYHNKRQKELAEQSKEELAASGKFEDPIATQIVEAPDDFWLAEEYHQNYYHKSTRDYMSYYIGSGRQSYIKNNWPDYYETYQKAKKKLEEPK